jgi:hypothetical protein
VAVTPIRDRTTVLAPFGAVPGRPRTHDQNDERRTPEVPVEGGTGTTIVSPASRALRDEMAVSGSVCWPPAGKFRWPPTGNDTRRQLSICESILVQAVTTLGLQ